MHCFGMFIYKCRYIIYYVCQGRTDRMSLESLEIKGYTIYFDLPHRN